MEATVRELIRHEIDRRVRSKPHVDPMPVGSWIRCGNCAAFFQKKQPKQSFCDHGCQRVRSGKW
jgi:hypothetical protein